ncbi:MAG: hypothetical protein ACYC2H_09575 [Thermoplasmatota archaeon]
MARLRVPAVALGLLRFIFAVVAGVLFFALGNGHAGAAWALAILLGIVVTATAIAVLRGKNWGRADEP